MVKPRNEKDPLALLGLPHRSMRILQRLGAVRRLLSTEPGEYPLRPSWGRLRKRNLKHAKPQSCPAIRIMRAWNPAIQRWNWLAKNLLPEQNRLRVDGFTHALTMLSADLDVALLPCFFGGQLRKITADFQSNRQFGVEQAVVSPAAIWIRSTPIGRSCRDRTCRTD